jgi:hypothetical protein
MGCVITLIALVAPRLFMVLVFLLTDWFGRAFDSMLWPFLGFLFLPYTTLVYMGAMLNHGHRVGGLWLVLLVVAVVVDLGHLGGTERQRRRRGRTPG